MGNCAVATDFLNGKTEGKRNVVNLKVTYRSFANVLARNDYLCCD
jgi:hypothetical protein